MPICVCVLSPDVCSARRPGTQFSEILAFPCNQFGYQEKGCDVDIKEFAKKKGAKFTMMSKIDVVRHPACTLLEHMFTLLICPHLCRKWSLQKICCSKFAQQCTVSICTLLPCVQIADPCRVCLAGLGARQWSFFSLLSFLHTYLFSFAPVRADRYKRGAPRNSLLGLSASCNLDICDLNHQLYHLNLTIYV